MGWTLTTLPFTSVQGVSSYTVTFQAMIPGAAGIALDDVRLCGPAAPTPTASPTKGASITSLPSPSKSALPVGATPSSSPAPSSAPAPTDQVVITITADNTFELYIDGTEIPPANAAGISDPGGCSGKAKLGPSKYCCAGSVDATNPRCNWPSVENLTFTIKNSSIMAVHVSNFYSTNPQDSDATPPLQGGTNPAGLLASWTRQGRVCGVTDSEWRCTHDMSAADIASGAWTTYNYNDVSWAGASGLFGANRDQAWVPLGTGPAKLYGGNSIWYAANSGPEPGIASYAQWMWTTPLEAHSEAWCRLYIPNLYC